MHAPSTVEELRDAVIELRRVHVRGGGTKPGLSANATLTTEKLVGVSNYDPGEFTFTAMAGTPLAEIRDMLSEHRQFLAFDPPLVEAGGTLGGVVAAGLSGPGRLRFGGVRDFLLGARLVTGEGRIVFGGGKVVKNAAGFDIPKLMVGARGQYGVLAELTFKVFPAPESYATLEIQCESLEETLQLQSRIASSPLEPACLDLVPPGKLFVRVGGLRSAQDSRIERLRSLCKTAGALQVHVDEKEDTLWRDAREFAFANGYPTLIRVALTAKRIPDVDRHVARWDALRRYSVAGNLAWIAAPSTVTIEMLEAFCEDLSCSAVVLRGMATPSIGALAGEGFRRRLRTVFDPQEKLGA